MEQPWRFNQPPQYGDSPNDSRWRYVLIKSHKHGRWLLNPDRMVPPSDFCCSINPTDIHELYILSTINRRIQPLFVGNWTLSNRGPILYPSPLALWGKWSASLRPWRRGWRGERHSEQQPLDPPPGALERSNSPPRSNGKISNYQCHETQIARKTIGMCVCVLFIYREREMILYDILSWLICGTPTSSKSHRTQEKSPQERPWPFPPPSPLRDAIVRFLHQNIEACFDVFWCLPTSTIPAQPNHRFPQRLQLKVPPPSLSETSAWCHRCPCLRLPRT